MLNHAGLNCSQNSNMDLEPSAPYASASSFPSPAEFQTGEELALAYEKLRLICEGGTSTSENLYPKFPFTVSTSSKGLNLGIDMSCKLFPPPLPQSFQEFPPPVVPDRAERFPSGPYLSQNKIVYRIPGTGAGSKSALQGILEKVGRGITPASVDTEQIKQQHQHANSFPCQTSSRISEKIRNLDDMLRSLEHYSVAKRFTSDVRRERDMKLGLNTTEDKQRRSLENSETPISGQPTTATFGVNKALSRLEFKAQMDKLTGVIEDRWLYGGNKKVGTKSSGATESSSSTRKDDLQPTQQDISTPASNPLTSVTRSHMLEEMMRRVAGLERCLTKKDRQKQSKLKGLDDKGRLNVQRVADKRMAFLLQSQFRRHAASVNQRLDKTDLAIKSLRQRHARALIPFHSEATNNGHGRESHLGQVNGDGQKANLANLQRNLCRKTLDKREAEEKFADEEWMDDQETISRNMQRMEDELCTLRKESQYMSHTLEKVQKLYSEQSMETELCWAAINHLCVDNNTFRDQLRTYLTNSQKRPESSYHMDGETAWEMQSIKSGQEGKTNLECGIEM